MGAGLTPAHVFGGFALRLVEHASRLRRDTGQTPASGDSAGDSVQRSGTTPLLTPCAPMHGRQGAASAHCRYMPLACTTSTPQPHPHRRAAPPQTQVFGLSKRAFRETLRRSSGWHACGGCMHSLSALLGVLCRGACTSRRDGFAGASVTAALDHIEAAIQYEALSPCARGAATVAAALVPWRPRLVSSGLHTVAQEQWPACMVGSTR